jgi:hypothetical protein
VVLDRAAEAFLDAREREGASLQRDLEQKLAELRVLVDEIERLSKDSIDGYRDRLAARIREALADNQITPDEGRLLTECAIFADKVAVDEELVRLRTHFGSMEQIFASDEAVGRKLDFLYTAEGARINAGNVSNLLKYLPNAVIRAQFLQETKEEVRLLLEIDPELYREEYDELLRREFAHKFGLRTRLVIEHVEEIPREASGKFRMIKNNVQE